MPQKVKMQLAGQDGNAFSLLGAFRRTAIRQGWTSEEVAKVVDEAMQGDYDHLLRTLISNTEAEDE